MAVLRPLRLVITDWPDGHVDTVDVVNNPEDPAAGTRARALRSGDLVD
jgi:glutaminyl-tRNA synthetase